MRALLTAFVCLFALNAWAAPDLKGADPGFEQMKEFLRQENERIKAIKILNLDLERADLELKKRQIEIKLANLNKHTVVPAGPASAVFLKPAFKLRGIFTSAETRQALINANGVTIQAIEGQTVGEGVTVKQITNDAAVLEYTDGKQETLNLGP